MINNTNNIKHDNKRQQHQAPTNNHNEPQHTTNNKQQQTTTHTALHQTPTHTTHHTTTTTNKQYTQQDIKQLRQQHRKKNIPITNGNQRRETKANIYLKTNNYKQPQAHTHQTTTNNNKQQRQTTNTSNNTQQQQQANNKQ